MAKKMDNLDRVSETPPNPSVARKKLLVIAGILAGIGGVWWGAQKLFQEQTPDKKELDRTEDVRRQTLSAEEFFKTFPDKIPGASKIEKFSTPNAKHCIVHIRDLHETGYLLDAFEQERLTPELIAQLTPEEKKTLDGIRADMRKQAQAIAAEAAEVGRDTERILAYLVEHHSIDTVYIEGITEKNEGLFVTIPKLGAQQKATERKLEETIKSLSPLSMKRLELQQKLDDLRDTRTKLMTSVQEALRGAADLYWAGKIRVKGADDERALDVSTKAIIRGADPKTKMLAMRDIREELFLHKAMKNPVTVVRFGGNHTWRDNIEDWNKNVPEELFSLIEITPASYRE